MDLDVLTGLSDGQRLVLFVRCRKLLADVARPGGRPPVLGLYRSVMLVVGLMRKNVTQEFAGAIFGVSQSTVSRRWDLLRPVIRQAVTSLIPHPREVLGAGTALVDGTIAPTWDWKHIPDLFSTKENLAGMNVQVAATLNGKVAAIGPFAVHGARHDAYAFPASGLKEILADIPAAADLGYVGVEGIEIIPVKRAAGCDLRAMRSSTPPSVGFERRSSGRSHMSRAGGCSARKEAGSVLLSRNSRRHFKRSSGSCSSGLLNKPPGRPRDP